MKHYIAIIIGAGQAGVPLANSLAKAGKKLQLSKERLSLIFVAIFCF
ncbi:hypothetical protein [Pedobacter sp. P26]